jgi:hypothetical protein
MYVVNPCGEKSALSPNPPVMYQKIGKKWQVRYDYFDFE